MTSDDKQQNLRLLEATAGMTANQRLVVMLYALHPTDRSGAVLETAAQLAKLVGMAPPVFWLAGGVREDRAHQVLPADPRTTGGAGRRAAPTRHLKRPTGRPSLT